VKSRCRPPCSTALARYTLRAEAHRETRPRLVLAALNQALLEWLVALVLKVSRHETSGQPWQPLRA
jgi:hypothetical protein